MSLCISLKASFLWSSAGSVFEALIQHQKKKKGWWFHNSLLVQYNCFAKYIWKVWFHTFNKVPQKTSWELSATRCSIHGKLAFAASCHFNLFIHARQHTEVSKRCRLSSSFFFFLPYLHFVVPQSWGAIALPNIPLFLLEAKKKISFSISFKHF